MQALIDPRVHKDKDFIPSSAQTYEKVRRNFSGLVRAVYRIEVVGADRLPATGPVVVAPNHESVLDPIVLGAAVSRELRFVAKAELWRSRLLVWMLDGLGAIPIERGHSDYLAAARVLQALEAGQAVVIFPQGAVYGDRVWKQGAAHAALVTGAPLVPVRLTAQHRPLAWQNRLSAVARHRRKANRRRVRPGRPRCGGKADRAVTRRRRIAGLTASSGTISIGCVSKR